MRVAVIFVAMVVITTPTDLSASCMSKGEARHHFGSVHIYWHGSDHCWDASPTRRHAGRAQRQAHRQDVHEVQEPKWRKARSEILTANEPASPSQESADQSDATAASVSPIKLVSSIANWSERWIDVAQVGADHLIKAQSNSIAAPAPEPTADDTTMAGAVALFAFGLGMVLTSIALLWRSGNNYIRPPPSGDASHVLGDKSFPTLLTLTTPGARWILTVRHLVVGVIAYQANFVCRIAVRWMRHVEDFISRDAYPMETKWSPSSAGAIISREDVRQPFTVPSRLLEEAKHAASRSISSPVLSKPQVTSTDRESGN